MTTAQEQQYSDLLALSGRSGGTFNELMIAASQRVTGFAPGTYDEAYISLLQSLTGDTTTSSLPALQAKYADMLQTEPSGVSFPTWARDFSRVSSIGSDITFTRASAGTYGRGDDAAITFASGVARVGSKGLLVEESRTNSFLNSSSPATHTSPSLGTGAYTLWLDGSGSIAVAGNTATITGAGTATEASAVTFTVTGAGTVNFTVTGSPTRAQCENGAFITSYIETAGVAATRAADVASITGINTAPWFNTSVGTVVARAEVLANAASSGIVYQLEDGAAARLVTFKNGGSATNFSVFGSGGTYITGTMGIIGTPKTSAVAYAANDVAFYGDGASLGTDASFTVEAFNALLIGTSSVGGVAYLNGYLSRLEYYPRRLPNAVLVGLTT